MVRITVNQADHALDTDLDRSLLEVLRDELGLTGTKYGCGEGVCGACTVLVDGAAARACTLMVRDLDGVVVTTIEGVSDAGRLHPVQHAMVERRALQCGYCSPGMVMSAVALLRSDPQPTAERVDEALAGNVCRCGGYPRIRDAVVAAGHTQATSKVPDDAADQREVCWTFVLPPLEPSRDRRWGWTTPGGARLTVDAGGRFRAYVGKVDGGQGNRWSLTRALAAELGVPTSLVTLEMGDTAESPFDLGTFGSRSTPDAMHVVRLLAAAARRALADVDIARTGPCTVTVSADEPLDPTPTGVADLDTDALRRGLVAAVTGAKRFPSDRSLPGMLHGRVLRPPARGAVLTAVDTSAARAMDGAQVVEEDDFVAVAAPSRHLAGRALAAVVATWDVPDGLAAADLEHHLRSHPIDQPGWGGVVDHGHGDVDAAMAGSDAVVESTYTTAYIAHTPLEPRVALADPAGGRLTVWVGTQRPFSVRSEVAAAVDMAEDDVRVIVPDFGGGFGGKHTSDVAVEAARIAMATGRPVRVAWSRAEEFAHAYFRPAAVIDIRAGACRDGTLAAWQFTNINSGAAGLMSPYAVANVRERFQPAESPLAQGSYRALAATANNFARESHLDEVACAIGADPVQLRLRHLDDERLRHVLELVVERIGSAGDRGAKAGIGVGVACGREKDGRVATAAEVSVDAAGTLRVRRIVTAFDCGGVVDADGLRLQITGAVIMGLGGALWESIRFDRGRVLTAGLSDYRVPRFPDVPPIDVIVVDRPDVEPAGAGETPIIAVAPAIANAVRAATGVRLRSLPLVPDGVVR